MLQWDVLNGVSIAKLAFRCKFITYDCFLIEISFQVARRCWSGNDNAMISITQAIQDEPGLEVTLPHEILDDTLVETAFLSLQNQESYMQKNVAIQKRIFGTFVLTNQQLVAILKEKKNF